MMNFKFIRKVLFTLVTILLVLGNSLAFADDQGTFGGDDAAPVSVTISPFITFSNSSHVANGVALRNRTSGTIHLRGVPISSPVVKAFLYWNYSDMVAIGATTSPALFNGNLIIGNKTADNRDPCWNMTGNHTYRSDVTPWVLSSPGHPNQDYQVVIGFNSKTSTTGQNPWSPWEAQKQRLEGATLVVVYEGSGKVSIYDKLNGTTMFGGTGTFNLVFSPSSSWGLFTVTGADGQRQGVYGNTDTFFNGNLILDNWGSNPGYPANDWNGNTGAPFPQLWDVHTHWLPFLIPGVNQQVSFNVANDCVVPVAFVLDD